MVDIDKLEALSTALDGRRWSWWDSNSFRRLTFVERSGWHGQDGGALHPTVSRHDGHPDVQMAPGVREFVEEANPAVVLELIAELRQRQSTVADLAMLVQRLCRQLRRAEPAGDQYKRLSDDALDYLKRKGILGSPLRGDQ